MTRRVIPGSTIFRKALLRSSGQKILVGAVCLLVAVCLHAPVALAQHGGAAHGGGFGGGHFGGGGGHFGGGHSGGGGRSGAAHGARGAGSHGSTSAPAPTAPQTTASVAHGPVALVSPTRFNSLSSQFRPRPVPHPTPQPTPIIFVPVFFTSPFFFWGGFNSFGCDPFWGYGCYYSPFYGYGGFGGFGYGGFGYGGYYGGLYNGWGWGGYGGGYGGSGIGAGSNVYSSGPTLGGQSNEPAQTYVSPSYPTDTRRDLVELFFKDGTVYDVTDYWLADGQLHFLTVDVRGEKAVEHVVPYDTLDLQTTVDDNTSRGFKFQLRGESMEQYFRNHPEVVPKVDPEKPSNQ